jgi:multicomponent Na+:H+ antiporter subunit B
VTPHSHLLEKAARPLYWLMLAGAVWIVLRGHNAPGGGFIGGLLAVAASAMYAIIHGVHTARRYQPLSPLSLALIGVGLAMLSGLANVAAGHAYLTHLWGPMGLSTVLLFDLGVFCTVWGSLSGYIYALLTDMEHGS